MKISAMCIRCLMDRQEEKVRGVGNEGKRSAYLKEVAGVIASAPEDASAPYLVYEINMIYKRYFGKLPDYGKEKKEFNELMLELEPELEKDIRLGSNEAEVLGNAINYARTANYIDYGAMNHVEKETLLELLRGAKGETLDEDTFQKLREDLRVSKKVVYLADNCGEIVADKLLIKVLMEQYPQIHITVIVRGMPALNDAVLSDAEAVGLADMVKVIGNGNGVAGTQISLLSEEASDAVYAADVIVSKGQGNFETIHGCGLNIYYLFLCKCDWFTKKFGMDRLKGVFVNERDIDAEIVC